MRFILYYVIIAFFALTVASKSESLELGLKYCERLDHDTGYLKFDPTIRWYESRKKFEVIYFFSYKGTYNDSNLALVRSTFWRHEIDLIKTICKVTQLKDGESLEVKDLISIKKVGDNITGVIYDEDGGVFLPREFKTTYESAVEFSNKVIKDAKLLNSAFGGFNPEEMNPRANQ